MIDASIPLGFRHPQVESPLNALAQFSQIQGMQNQNKLAAMGMQEKQRAIDDERNLTELMRTSRNPDTGEVDPLKVRNAIAEKGTYGQLNAFEKQQLEHKKTQAGIDKDAAETQEKKYNIAKGVYELMGAAAGAIKNAPTYENAVAITTRLKQSLPPGVAEKITTDDIPRTPEEIERWATNHWTQVVSATKQMEDDRSRANNAATNATSRANNAATVAASYANAAATRSIAAATRDAAAIQRDQATEMKLGDDYRAQSKDFKSVADAYKQINSTLDKATTSPAATLAAATKFMKLLDPGSVVRESELGMALAASGVFDRAANYFNTLQKGRVLTPNQVADFKNITQQIYGAAQAGQKDVDANYKRQAEAYKLRPEMIIQDLGQNAAPKGPPAAASAKVPANVQSLLDKYK